MSIFLMYSNWWKRSTCGWKPVTQIGWGLLRHRPARSHTAATRAWLCHAKKRKRDEQVRYTVLLKSLLAVTCKLLWLSVEWSAEKFGDEVLTIKYQCYHGQPSLFPRAECGQLSNIKACQKRSNDTLLLQTKQVPRGNKMLFMSNSDHQTLVMPHSTENCSNLSKQERAGY